MSTRLGVPHEPSPIPGPRASTRFMRTPPRSAALPAYWPPCRWVSSLSNQCRATRVAMTVCRPDRLVLVEGRRVARLGAHLGTRSPPRALTKREAWLADHPEGCQAHFSGLLPIALSTIPVGRGAARACGGRPLAPRRRGAQSRQPHAHPPSVADARPELAFSAGDASPARGRVAVLSA